MARNIFYDYVDENDANNYFDEAKIIDKICPVMLYEIIIDDDKYEKIDEWCRENLSEIFCLWADCFQCTNDIDMIAFKLRWI